MPSKYLAAISILALGACTEAGVSEPVKSHVEKAPVHQHDHAGNYKKPGASVTITSDYDGKTELGNIDTITVTVSEEYDAGTMTIKVKPDSNLIFHSNPIEQQIDLASAGVHQLTFKISAEQDGQYPILVTATVESNGQFSRRDETVLIKVGNQKKQAQQKSNEPAPTKFVSVEETVTD